MAQPTYDRFFLAEKSSAGMALAEYLSRRNQAPLQKNNHYCIVGRDVIGFMAGHLYELYKPHEYNPEYQSWKLDHLPIIPDNFEFHLKPRANRQGAVEPTIAKINALRSIMAKCGTIVGFGDPDAEGQLLQDEFLIETGHSPAQAKRLWASSLDDSTFDMLIDALPSNADFVGFYEQALCRSHADWLYGMNMSRACTLLLRQAGGDLVFPVGRVQTPTTYLVVKREHEIRVFKPIDYYCPFIDVGGATPFRAKWVPRTGIDGRPEDIRVDDDGRIVSRQVLDDISAKVAPTATVHSVTKTPVTEKPPIPFSLSALQSHLGNKYKFGVAKTLAIAQSLYLKKLTSYPRVDTGYLPENLHPQAPSVLMALASSNLPPEIGKAIAGANSSLKSRAWNDKKVSAHYGIIPSAHNDINGAMQTLTDEELKAYCEIVKRYILQFHPEAKATKLEIVLACPEGDDIEFYRATGKSYQFQGWRGAFQLDSDATEGSDDAAEMDLPVVSAATVLPVEGSGFDARQTTPPKRYTEHTLTEEMKRIDRHVTDPELAKRLRESIGIGTEATRAPTIQELIEVRKFFEHQGKNQELHPTEAAMLLMSVLPDYMKSPDLTAKWQMYMDDVKDRRRSYKDFIAYQAGVIGKMVEAMPRFFKSVVIPPQLQRQSAPMEETNFKCFGDLGKAGCGAPLRRINWKGKWFFGCSDSACKKTFLDRGGNPVEKPSVEVDPNAPACPKCNKGRLRLRHRQSDGNPFWSCSNWQASRDAKLNCDAIFQDLNGAPDLTPPPPGAAPSKAGPKCPTCKKGNLVRRPRSDQTGYFWSCNNWRKDRPASDNCRAMYPDEDGKPVTKKRQATA